MLKQNKYGSINSTKLSQETALDDTRHQNYRTNEMIYKELEYKSNYQVNSIKLSFAESSPRFFPKYVFIK